MYHNETLEATGVSEEVNGVDTKDKLSNLAEEEHCKLVLSY